METHGKVEWVITKYPLWDPPSYHLNQCLVLMRPKINKPNGLSISIFFHQKPVHKPFLSPETHSPLSLTIFKIKASLKSRTNEEQ